MNDTGTNDISTNDSTSDTGTPTTGGRRSMAIGVAAGLLAGGAIGLVATVPSLTNAASDDSGEADVVLQEDTTDETTDETMDETADDTNEPGERLRETLQPLVDDGTITESQADAVAAHLVENRPERGDRFGRLGGRGLDGHGRNHTVLADVLGIDRETLRTELAAGNSIADIAEANGVEVQAVIDALVADAETHLDLAVEHGLDEERAATRLERITERIEDRVYDTRDTDG
jgi:hypothetical protein